MSQFDQNLAFSVEIAVFISVDVIEAIVLREGGIWNNRRSVAFLVSELFDDAIFVEMARCSLMAVAAMILGADHFGVMGAVASMALLGIDGGKRGSNRDGVRASGRRWFIWERSGWSRWFAVASPSIDLSLAPGYMVILVGEAAVGTVTFLGFGSWCRSRWWLRLDRVGWHPGVDNDLRRLVREDLLESILESFLDKGWDSCAGIVNMSEVKTVGVGDHSVERLLHFGEG